MPSARKNSILRNRLPSAGSGPPQRGVRAALSRHHVRRCGNNIHTKCLLIWAQHNRSIGEKITCPVRLSYPCLLHRYRPVGDSSAALSGDPSTCTSTRAPHRVCRPGGAPLYSPCGCRVAAFVHMGTTCKGCGISPIIGPRLRCLICAEYSLCADCYKACLGRALTPTSGPACAAECPVMILAMVRRAGPTPLTRLSVATRAAAAGARLKLAAFKVRALD